MKKIFIWVLSGLIAFTGVAAFIWFANPFDLSVWLILIVSSFLLVRIFSKSESSWDSLMSGEDKSD